MLSTRIEDQPASAAHFSERLQHDLRLCNVSWYEEQAIETYPGSLSSGHEAATRPVRTAHVQNLRFFCSRLRSGLLVERSGMQSISCCGSGMARWGRIHRALYATVRERNGRAPSASAAIIDGQSAKAAQ